MNYTSSASTPTPGISIYSSEKYLGMGHYNTLKWLTIWFFPQENAHKNKEYYNENVDRSKTEKNTC